MNTKLANQQKRQSLHNETLNQSSLTAGKSELNVSSEKGIIKTNQSNICGGNLHLYHNENNFLNYHKQYYSTEEKALFDENPSSTQENYVFARQNSQKNLESLIDSPNMSFQNIKKKEQKGILDTINALSFYKTRMICFYRNFTYSGRAKCIRDEARRSIDDISDYSEQKNCRTDFNLIVYLKEKEQKCISVIEKILIFLQLSRLPLFDPENIYRIIFNSILMSYNCFFLIVISLKIFFNADFGHLKEILHEIALAGWVTEMLMNMNTSTYHKGQFITDRKQIISIYINEYFFFEIIPLIFENLNSQNIWVDTFYQVPLLLKIKGIMIIYDKIEFFILHSVKRRYILEILKLIFKLILLTHIMACSYNAFLQFEIHVLNISETWGDLDLTDSKMWYSYYAQAQVWAFTTMCNTTSKSIKTTQEYLFTSFWMLISCIAFAYLINKIGSILSELNSHEDCYRDDINLLNQFMKRKNINLGLQRLLNVEIKQYYRSEQLKKKIDVRNTLSKLSKPMYKHLMQEAYKKVLNVIPYFNNFLTEVNQSRIYEIMEEIGYSSHQLIEDNEIDSDTAIFYVLKGKFILNQINPFDDNTQTNNQEIDINQKAFLKQENIQQKKIYKPIKIVNEGECFGIQEFLTGQRRRYIAESQKLSVVIKISLDKFLEIIRNDEQDFQRYQQCKDKILFGNNISFLEQTCYSCGNNDHYFIDCTQTHFNKNNPFFFPKNNFCTPQIRDCDFKRKPRVLQNVFYKHCDEDEEYSQKSSATIVKKEKQIDSREESNMFSANPSEKDVEKIDSKIKRNSSQTISNNKRASLQDRTDDQLLFSPVDKMVSNSHTSIQVGMGRNSQTYDSEQLINPKVYVEKQLSEDLIEDPLNDQTKIKQKRRISNKGYQNIFRVSTLKKGSIEELNQINSKNNPIEEIKESDRENDPSIQEFHQQNSININKNLLYNNHPQLTRYRNSDNITFYAMPNSHSYGRSIFMEQISQRKLFVEWKDSLDYWKFDQMKQMNYYFPDGNFRIILKKLQKIKLKNKPKSKNKNLNNFNMQSSMFRKYQTFQKNKTTTPISYQFFQTKLMTIVQNE